MPRAKPIGQKWRPKTHLQALFLKRLVQEMAAQNLNTNSLSKREWAPPQRTIHDVLAGRDPTLETVWRLAIALDVPAHELMREKPEGAVSPRGVSPLPSYPRILQQPESSYRKKKARDSSNGSR